MPDEQNQNNQYTNTDPNQQPQGGFDTQNQGFSTDPSQTYADQTFSAQPAYDTSSGFGDPATDTYGDPSEAYSSDFGNPTGTNSQQQDFNQGLDQNFQTFDQTSSSVPPLDGQINPQPTNQAPNTFEQKKTGSKIFLYGSIIVVVILLIAMGVLSYFNFFAPGADDTGSEVNTAQVDEGSSDDTPSDDQNSDDDEQDPEDEVTIDVGSTGGPNTPASQSRANEDTEIPNEWLLQKFTRPEIDLDGNCLNLNVCGNQADPDNDGATNLVEYNFDLDPLENDTDRDLIADGDELFVYYTDPRDEASDDDNFSDSVELTGCYDPISTSTAKMNNQRRSQIASNVTLRPLHEPTISLLQDAGATQSDIINRAIPLSACPTENTSTNSSTTTDDTESGDSI